VTKIDEAIRKLRAMADDDGPVRQVAARPARDAGQVVASEKPFAPAALRTVRINTPQLADLGYAVPEEDRTVLAAQYRVIKRPLVAQAFGRLANQVEDGNFVQVTSSVPGEGKTFTCLNLAMSIAQERDYSVLLVDADVLNPRLSQVFGLGAASGLLDYLADPARSAAAMAYPTDIPGLAVMSSGKPRENGAELLSGARMAAFVNEVVRRHPDLMVIVDSPPVLLTSESRILAESVGQIVVVVRAGHTLQDSARQCVEALPAQKPINFVLNRVSGRTAHGAYEYGYGSSAPSVRDGE
jgi:protein-tyrosine kinase